MLCFCLWVAVVFFVGTVYPLQIDGKRQKYVCISNPCVVNSSEVAAIFNSQKQASTSILRNTSLLRRDKKNYKRDKLFSIVFNLQFVIVIHKLLFFTGVYTKKSIFSHK